MAPSRHPLDDLRETIGHLADQLKLLHAQQEQISRLLEQAELYTDAAMWHVEA